MAARDALQDLQRRMATSIIGQEQIIERLLIGLLANGNLLVEGLPGLAKTRAVKSLAKNLEAGLSRIQFTPDLLPSDITGTEVYYQADGKGEFASSGDRSSTT
jgi:MoxR-like ATPase